MASTPNHVQLAACRCGPPPQLCVPDDAVLTQFAWREGAFRSCPRPERQELGLSVLLGHVPVYDAARYVLLGEQPDNRQLRNAVVRLTTAGALRLARFAVVHTPGRIKAGIHVTVVWPDSDPLSKPDGGWNASVSDTFNSCFNR